MGLNRESLPVLLDRIHNNYLSKLSPLDNTARHNLIRVLAEVDAGIYHQLLGDLSFLADQIFPDTATGDYLRMHWSDRVPPLYAVCAVGKAEVEGITNTSVPAGLVYSSASGKRYFTDISYKINESGKATIWLKAQEPGTGSNLAPCQELKLSSAIPAGLTSKAITVDNGIVGGVDEETDAEYLSRVLLALRNTTRYGKIGDFAAWAIDSSAGVTNAFEIKNFGIFGSLLIQVINGNHFDGISTVGNLQEVTGYIDTVAPPILYEVRTPVLKPMNLVVTLLASETSTTVQATTLNRIKALLNATAQPGAEYSEGQLKDAIIDGVTIKYAHVEIENAVDYQFKTTVLEYPVLGVVRFEQQ